MEYFISVKNWWDGYDLFRVKICLMEWSHAYVDEDKTPYPTPYPFCLLTFHYHFSVVWRLISPQPYDQKISYKNISKRLLRKYQIFPNWLTCVVHPLIVLLCPFSSMIKVIVNPSFRSVEVPNALSRLIVWLRPGTFLKASESAVVSLTKHSLDPSIRFLHPFRYWFHVVFRRSLFKKFTFNTITKRHEDYKGLTLLIYFDCIVGLALYWKHPLRNIAFALVTHLSLVIRLRSAWTACWTKDQFWVTKYPLVLSLILNCCRTANFIWSILFLLRIDETAMICFGLRFV